MSLNFSKIIYRVKLRLMNWDWHMISSKNIYIINTKNWYSKVRTKNILIKMTFMLLKTGWVGAKILTGKLQLQKFNSKICRLQLFYSINSNFKKKEILIYFISKKNIFLKIQTKAKLQVKLKSKKFNKSYTHTIYSLN